MKSYGEHSSMGGAIRKNIPGINSLPSKGSVVFRAPSFKSRDANKRMQSDRQPAAPSVGR